MAGQQCVDVNDFEVIDGVLHARTHAARMLNDVTIREIPSGETDLDVPVFEWTIPGADTLDYQYGSSITADPSNCRFIINEHGIYNISAAYGDNLFETNSGAKLYLTVYVGGASVMRGDADKLDGFRKAWPSISGDVEIPAGATVRFSYAIALCNPPAPPAPPVCGRSNHFLYPDNRNFFAIHRVGGL